MYGGLCQQRGGFFCKWRLLLVELYHFLLSFVSTYMCFVRIVLGYFSGIVHVYQNLIQLYVHVLPIDFSVTSDSCSNALCWYRQLRDYQTRIYSTTQWRHHSRWARCHMTRCRKTRRCRRQEVYSRCAAAATQCCRHVTSLRSTRVTSWRQHRFGPVRRVRRRCSDWSRKPVKRRASTSAVSNFLVNYSGDASGGGCMRKK